MTTDSSAIRLRDVSKAYGSVAALRHVDAVVESGNVLGLLGPNGAGKTTLIKILLGLLKADSGEVSVFGRSPQSTELDRPAYLPEERGIFLRESVRRVIGYFGRLKGLDRRESRRGADEWIARLELGRYADRLVDTLSKGNQQKVQFAAALIGTPPLIVLDEPMSGLDPVNTRLICGVIRELSDRGHTVVLSTHQMGLVDQLCEHVLMLNQGRVVLSGSVASIRQQYSQRTIFVETDQEFAGAPMISSIVRQSRGYACLLRPTSSGGELLSYLIAQGVTIRSYEESAFSLEDIFVRLAHEQ